MSIIYPLMPTHGQVVTGGNMAPRLVTAAIAKYRNTMVAKDTIKEMEKSLVARDAKCSPDHRLLKTNDLMQSYLKLSLFKNPSASADKCDEINKYFACLNDVARPGDRPFKAMAKDLKMNSEAANVLMNRYTISEPEANRILNFFHQMDKKVK